MGIFCNRRKSVRITLKIYLKLPLSVLSFPCWFSKVSLVCPLHFQHTYYRFTRYNFHLFSVLSKWNSEICHLSHLTITMQKSFKETMMVFNHNCMDCYGPYLCIQLYLIEPIDFYLPLVWVIEPSVSSSLHQVGYSMEIFIITGGFMWITVIKAA